LVLCWGNLIWPGDRSHVYLRKKEMGTEKWRNLLLTSQLENSRTRFSTETFLPPELGTTPIHTPNYLEPHSPATRAQTNPLSLADKNHKKVPNPHRWKQLFTKGSVSCY
jgi:hypothetical protein